MGIYFENFSEQNFMLAVLHDSVTDDDLDAHITRLLKPEYDQPGKTGLCVVCKNASTKKLSSRALISAGKRMKQATFRQKGKLAIVSNTTVGFGLAKIYQIATEVAGLDETRVLRGNELDTAMQWIGVSDFSSEVKHKVDQLESE